MWMLTTPIVLGNFRRCHCFWDYVCSVLKDVLVYEVPRTAIYLGKVPENVMGSDRYLIKVILAAIRKAITRNWYKVEAQNVKNGKV